MRNANRAGGLLLIGALIIVAVSAISLRRQAGQSDALTAESARIDAVSDAVTAALSSLKDAETGQRGFLLTGKESYLAPYDTGISEFGAKATALLALTATDPNASAIAHEIVREAELKKTEMAHVLALFRAKGQAAAIAAVNEDTGKRYMDAVRSASARMLALESSALTRNREEHRRVEDSSRWEALTSSGVLFLLTLAGTILLHIEIRNEKRLSETLDVSQRKYRDLAGSLDKQVEERTRELEVLNKELLAFSYSVSHDLRAPLRSIDGFSQIVLEDYADKLDENGRGMLERIRNAARRMGQLIQSLLDLSRVTRLDLSRQAFSLSDMALNAVEGLQNLSQGREVTVIVAPDLRIDADPELTRVLLDNLIHNAWKFTSKTNDARIEIGRTWVEEKAVFFVRDNGAGFDPAFASRLFTPFQRLHSENEFEGTGIGLATVQRIVNRHGGRIWAESEPDRGATFFFALS